MDFKKYVPDSSYNPQSKTQTNSKSTVSFGQKVASDNDKVDLADYLDRDFVSLAGAGNFIQEDNEYKAETLKAEIKSLNNALINYGFPTMGDLFSTKLYDIENTLKSISALLQQRQKDLEMRTDSFEKINKMENEKKGLQENMERLMMKKKSLENEVVNFESKYKLLEKTTKETLDKSNLEKEEMKKAIYKIQGKDTQYQHELRKKDALLKKCQEQIEKIQNDKKKLYYNNNFELSQALELNGPNLFSISGDTEFTQMMVKGYEEVHSKLLAENDILRERVSRINYELQEILNTRKELLIRTRKIEMGDDYTEDLDLNYSNLINFKKELLNMPLDSIGKETLDILQENIKRFKDFMKKMDSYSKDFEADFNDENDPDLEKIKPLKNLKNLIKNYKGVIEAQDSLINKAIVKTTLKENIDVENRYKGGLGNNNKIMDDKEIDQARKFLLEQKSYLDSKNKEMEITKSLINQTTKKLDDEKIFIAQKRQEIDEETEKNNKVLQNLIDKYMEFLNETVPIEEYDSKSEDNQTN